MKQIKNIFALFTMVVFMFHASITLADELPEKQPRDVVRKLTEEIGDSDTLASRDIALFAKVCGTEHMYGFLNERLNQLRNAGPTALPALASLLNRDIWNSYGNVPYSDRVIDSLRSSATEIWYDIRWRNLNESQKIKTAVMSMDPQSAVDLAPDIGMRKIITLGSIARPQLYAMLSSNATYRAYPLNARRISYLLKIFDSKVFTPTSDEVDKILQHGGEYGQFIMLSFAAKYNHYSFQWINSFIYWMKNKESSKKYSLLLSCEPPLRDRSSSPRRYFSPSNVLENKILSVGFNSAKKSVRKIVQNTANKADYLILNEVVSMAYKYGNINYLKQMKNMNHKLEIVLERADSNEILDHIARYHRLKTNIQDTNYYIKKLETIQAKKGKSMPLQSN